MVRVGEHKIVIVEKEGKTGFGRKQFNSSETELMAKS